MHNGRAQGIAAYSGHIKGITAELNLHEILTGLKIIWSNLWR